MDWPCSNKLRLNPITLDVDSTVLTRWGTQIEGGAKGYNPKHQGRASHHPLLAFVADWRLVANFWLRPGNTSSANNVLGFIEATLENLGATKVGLFRADSGFYDKTIVALLGARKISHIISARLTQALQQAIVDECKWQQVEVGLEVSELQYQPHGWWCASTSSARRAQSRARHCRCLPMTLICRVGAMG